MAEVIEYAADTVVQSWPESFHSDATGVGRTRCNGRAVSRMTG